MLDFLRNLRKSEEEKRQEALNAYLDDTLTSDQRQQLEEILEQDAGQQAQLDQMRLLQQQMRQLPRRRVPRNFTLNPALYGRPRRDPLVQAYPVLRTATALAAFFFIFALAANLFIGGAPGMTSSAEPVAMQAVPEAAADIEAAVEEEIAVAAEEEVIVTEAESVDRAAEAAPVEEEAVEETAGDALLPEKSTAVPEMERALEAADSAAAEMPMEAQEAPLFESAGVTPEPPMTDAAEAGALQAEPTMAPAATEVMADELAELAPAPATVAATIEVQLVAPAPATELRDEIERSKDGEQSQPGVASFLSSSLGVIVLLLGVVFVVLISLTLLARRRL
jgi:anti-sigma factor RsiW